MSANETYTNPAQRLHDILTQLGQQNPNHKTREILANVFDVDSADTVRLLRIVTGILSLIQEVRSHIEANADGQNASSKYLDAIVAIENAVSSYDLNDRWRRGCDAIMSIQEKIGHLEFASEYLYKNSQSLVVAEIEELKQSLTDLLAQIAESSIEDSVKKQLEIRLREMLEVLRFYKLYGDKGFAEVAEKALGCTCFRYDEVSKDEDLKKEIKKFFKKLSPMLKVVEVTAGIAGIANLLLE